MTEIKRALISVSDKTGVVEFARGLSSAGVEILSTGGTARALRDGGVSVIDVSEYTESPEIMDGRVKTLHPRVHGGILMRESSQDRDALGAIGGKSIDLVCVNLYPFEQTVARGASHDETIENIDIGGPSMVRSAAKNQARVTVVTDPSDYDEVLHAVKSGDGPNASLRARLAAKAFAQTAAYDGAIAAYLTSQGTDSKFPGALTLSFTKAYDVRYGENPHQQGAFYVERNAPAGSLAMAESLGAGGKELSFNNLVDVDATIEAVREFEGPAAVVVKHTNPCGVATADTLESAYRIAREADAQSAFGGIVALNREVDDATAEAVAETFIECIIAPSFAPAALERLQKKKNLRILATGEWLSGRLCGAPVQARRGRSRRARSRCNRSERGSRRQSRQQTSANRRGDARARFCLARLQAREVERDHLRQAGPHRGRRGRTNGAGDRRRHCGPEGGRALERRRHGLGRVLPFP